MRIAVAPPQLVEEMLEMRRQPGFGPDALLESFAHGIANRAAGAPVDLFAVIGRRSSHGGFRVLKVKTQYQVIAPKIVSPAVGNGWFSSKNCMNAHGIRANTKPRRRGGTPGLRLEGTLGEGT